MDGNEVSNLPNAGYYTSSCHMLIFSDFHFLLLLFLCFNASYISCQQLVHNLPFSFLSDVADNFLGNHLLFIFVHVHVLQAASLSIVEYW
jgi:hypothetical protein